MNPKIRLFRRPVTTLVWLAMLTVMALLISVTGGLVYSSTQLPTVLDRHHTTVAVQSYYEVQTQVGIMRPLNLMQEDIEILESLDMVKSVDLRTLTGAYIPELDAQVALKPWGDLHAQNYDNMAERFLNDSYNQVVVIGTVEDSWLVEEDFHYTDLSVLGREEPVKPNYIYAAMKVEEILVMNGAFDLFPTPEYSSYDGTVFVQACVYDETGDGWFQPGERYIVSGSYDPDAHGRADHTPYGDFRPWIEVNRRLMLYASEGVLEGDRITVYRDAELEIPLLWEEGTEILETLRAAEDPIPVAQKIEGTLEEFLAANPEWQAQIDEIAMAQHSFPVLGTQCLESMQYFITNAATIVEGRSFTKAEYDEGSKVIVINETMAQNGGISVGDTVSVSQFLVADSYAEGNPSLLLARGEQEANEPSIGRRIAPQGLATEDEKFTVVGIYRLERSWQESPFSFTPNTIFMPQKAQIEGGFGGPSYMVEVNGKSILTDSNGVSTVIDDTWEELEPRGDYGVYMSVILENGKMEEFSEAIAQTELADHRFLTFDQGYEAAQESLDPVIEAAKQLFYVAGAGWALLLILYILLYQGTQRKNLGIMLSLGARPGQTRRYLAGSGLILALVGVALGTALSGVVMDLVQEKLFGLTLSQAATLSHSGGMALDSAALTGMLAESSLSAQALLLLAAAQLGIIALALWLHAALLARKSPRKLMGV